MYFIGRDGIIFVVENDTRSVDYEVRYVRTKSPIDPIDTSASKVILSKRPEKGIYATGHCSVVKLPNKDEWRIVYHRFRFPDGVALGKKSGFHREVCIDKLEFDGEGNIISVNPTL